VRRLALFMNRYYPDMTTVLFVGEHTFAVEPVVTADGDFYRVVHVTSGAFIAYAHNVIDAQYEAEQWVKDEGGT
jgi:hypothetical protein